MVKGISVVSEPNTFRNIVRTGQSVAKKFENIQGLPITQKNILMRSMSEDLDPTKPEITEAYSKALDLMGQGRVDEGLEFIKPFKPNEAAVSETSLGIAVMAKGWSKPVIFPKEGEFKFVGWADRPDEISTQDLWDSAYGYTPTVRFGAVGYSNVKPEQVRGGCSLSKAELSKKYEGYIQDFYRPIINYLKDNGAKAEDMGFAYSHTYDGVDKAARNVAVEHGLKSFGTTPTEYTQYVKVGKEIPASEEFPNGAVLADFPFPTVLTRNVGQIVDYTKIYGKMVGKENPMGIFNGRQHAFVHDTGNAMLSKGGARWIPCDIMKEHGFDIPARNSDDEVINASRQILEEINPHPYDQYLYAFKHYLPNTMSKQDLTNDAQKSIATIAYTELANAGKIG